MTTHVSRAEVATEAPARYAKQLVAHFGRRIPFTTDGDTATATLAGASVGIAVGDGVLTLTASAADPEAVARAAGVLGSHLERFGQRRELVVTWQHTTEGAGR